MELFVDRFEALLIHVGVDLGGGDIGVAEEFLNDSEVGAILQEMGGKGMAEEVGVDVLIDPGLLGALFDNLADALR